MYDITFFYTLWNNIPVAVDSSVDPSGHFDYSYAHIEQLIVEDFVSESPPWWFSSFFFLFTFKKKNENIIDKQVDRKVP